MNPYVIALIVTLIACITAKIAVAIYFNPHRVIDRCIKREASKARLKAIKAFGELKQYDNDK